MAEPFATPDQVAALLGSTFTPAETGMVAARLDQASAQIRMQIPNVDARIDAGLLDRAVVAQVAADMVIRVVQNPLGARQMSRQIDDYQSSVQIDSARSEGALYLSVRERALLRGRRSRAFTIVPTRVPDVVVPRPHRGLYEPPWTPW